ncbi:glucokinase [Acuticoccus sp. M5D2P5]|uniref:glucokinase n=1 Tax=Acuticoccus kalidii TaxID=2910977 RepID=UPI001F19D5FB|nr:glucokinase [Acuticoccus kalidii]MCF3934833.1 glucokinase [Acuticoccus kalidii]
MPWTSREALIGDIGGTHARFATCDLFGNTIRNRRTLSTKAFASFEDALTTYLSETGVHAATACLAVAGPVESGAARLTNAPWSFSEADIRRVAGVFGAHLVNDFEALARAVPQLDPDDLVAIKAGRAEDGATLAVLGPGTGFGVASLVPCARGWTGLPGEGGHMTFGAINEEEWVIHDHLSALYDHVSVERVLSGAGLEAIDIAFGGPGRTAREIVESARRGEGGTAPRTLDAFVRILARVAGDVALVVGATGGVFLGGGIAPKILDFLDSEVFRAAFVAKGRMARYLSDIPVHVITAADGGLRGAAAIVPTLVPDVARVGWANVRA